MTMAVLCVFRNVKKCTPASLSDDSFLRKCRRPIISRAERLSAEVRANRHLNLHASYFIKMTSRNEALYLTDDGSLLPVNPPFAEPSKDYHIPRNEEWRKKFHARDPD